MYHQHGYSVTNGEDHLSLPTYMYNGSSYGEAESCPWYDPICMYNQYTQKKQDALTADIYIPSTNKTLLAGISISMILVFGVGAYFLLFRGKK